MGGGKPEHIEFVPVLRKGFEEEDREIIDERFGNFDAAHATCSKPDDKQRLLDIVHTAFGDVGNFNTVVQAIFEEAGWCEEYVKARLTEMGGSVMGSMDDNSSDRDPESDGWESGDSYAC